MANQNSAQLDNNLLQRLVDVLEQLNNTNSAIYTRAFQQPNQNQAGGTGNPTRVASAQTQNGNFRSPLAPAGYATELMGEGISFIGSLPHYVAEQIQKIRDISIFNYRPFDWEWLNNAEQFAEEYTSIWADVAFSMGEGIKAFGNLLSGELDKASVHYLNFMKPSMFMEAIDEWYKLNDAIYKTGSELGRTAGQMEILQSQIVKGSEHFSRWFNIEPDQLVKTLETYSEMTGRVRMPTENDMFQQAYLTRFNANDILGSFDDVGASTSVATANFVKLQQNAGALGLNLKKAKDTLKESIKLMDKVTFKDGVSGLQRMVLLTQQMKLNMNDITQMANKFGADGNIENAIQTSAQLNALGGSFAMNFSNPLEMLNLAVNDAEGLMVKLKESLAGKGSFNWNTGTVDIDPATLMQIRQAAGALGIDADSVVKSARRQALEQAMITQFDNSKFTQSQRDMITNRAEYNAETGRFEVSVYQGDGTSETKSINELTTDDLVNIVSTGEDPQDAQLDIRDNVRDIAYLLRNRLVDRSVRSMSIQESYNAGRNSARKDFLNVPEVIYKRQSQGGVGWGDSVRNRQAYGTGDDFRSWQGESVFLGNMKGEAPFASHIQKVSNELVGQIPIPLVGQVLNGVVSRSTTLPFMQLTKYMMQDKGIQVEGSLRDAEYFHFGDWSNSNWAPDIQPYDWSTMMNPNPRPLDTNVYRYTPTIGNQATGNYNGYTETGGWSSNVSQIVGYTGNNGRSVTPEQARSRVSVRSNAVRPSRQSSSRPVRIIESLPMGIEGLEEDTVNRTASTIARPVAVNPITYSTPQTPERTSVSPSESTSVSAPVLETTSQIAKYIQQVEGVVDINDPLLANKALTSVIKIHELLVARYGVMELQRNDMVIRDNLQGVQVRQGSIDQSVLNNSIQKAGSTSGNNNGKVDLKIDLSGTVKLDSGNLTLNLDDRTMKELIDKLLNTQGFATNVVNKYKQENGTGV